jgi:predicted nucleic acid-binding protein
LLFFPAFLHHSLPIIGIPEHRRRFSIACPEWTGRHEPAVAATESLRGKDSTILVPYEVYIETLNVLGKRVGHIRALAVASYLSNTPLFLVIDSSAASRQEALSRFTTLPQSVSFTDAVVMAIADEYRTGDIFGFDEAFAKSGYQIIEKKTATRKAH